MWGSPALSIWPAWPAAAMAIARSRFPIVESRIAAAEKARPASPLLLGGGADAGEARVEPRQAAAAIQELLRTAGPGRMGVRIDVEVEGRALLAVGRAGVELRPVGHHDLDHVVIGMDVGLHGAVPAKQQESRPADRRLSRLTAV